MENDSSAVTWMEKRFILENPTQIPKAGDILFHVSPGEIERFETKIPGSMFFTKARDLFGLTSNKNRFLYTVRVKKDFPLNMLAVYHRDRKCVGWGVRLNEGQTAVKWLDVSNELLDDYLEIIAVEELPTQQLVQEPPTPSEIRLQQKQANFYLPRLMNQQLTDADLLSDKGQILEAVGRLRDGAVNTEYSTAQIDQRLIQLGWIPST